MTTIRFVPNRWAVDKIKREIAAALACLEASYGNINKDDIITAKLLEARFQLQGAIEAIDSFIEKGSGVR